MTVQETQKPEIEMVEWCDDHFYKVKYQNEYGVDVQEYIPSVTTKLGAIAKPFLIQWYGDLGNREANIRKFEQADRGSRIHHAWYTYATGGVVIFNPPKKPNFTRQQADELFEQYKDNVCILQNQDEMLDMDKLKRWCDYIKPTFLGCEYTVCSLKNRDAGTVDNKIYTEGGEFPINGRTLITIPKGKYILDIKTGNYIGKEAEMQVSAYFKCDEDMTNEDDLMGAIILHTGSKIKSGIEGLSTILMLRDDIEKQFKNYRLISQVWESNFGNLKPKVLQIPNLITLKEPDQTEGVKNETDNTKDNRK